MRLVPAVLFLAIGVSAASAASGQQLSPKPNRDLAKAATDARLLPWQRQIMSQLAGEQRPKRATSGTDGSWSELIIGARSGHSAIYDPVRDRLIVYGGQDGSLRNDVWALALNGSPTWTALAPLGAPPGLRRYQSAIYDPVGDRMILFGGLGAGGYQNDVWALSLNGTPTWTALSPAGPFPAPRELHSAVYDSLRHRMLVFGGYSGVLRNDVWVLSLTGPLAWTQLAASGTPPVARQGHSAIYDPVRDRMVIFGGYNEASGSRNDVMTLSLAGTPTWTAIAPAGQLPNGRSLQSGVYDPVRDRLLIFGGGGDSGNFGDTWALNLGGAAIWTAVQAVGPAPSARAGHVAVYDPIRDGMVVFGGINGAYLNDTWRLGGTSAAWSSLVSAPLPISRQAHSAIYDSARDRVLIFGGYDGSHAFYNDVWALTLTGTPAWTPVSTTGTPPVAREGHTAIYDAARDRMVVFGGDDGVNSFNDAWSLALSGTPTWSPLLSVGTPPAARSGHSAIYDRSRGRMVVFGGNGIENDVWFLSLTSTPAWTRGDPTGVLPPPRYLHTAIADPARGRMIVFGGNDGVNSFNDVWALDLSGSAWTPLSPLGAPPNPRYLHGAIYDPVRDRMIVFGGWDGAERNSAWALTFAGTPSWSELAPGGNFPAPRLASSCVYSPVRDGMIVFGGSFGSINRNDAWALVWGAPIAGVVSPTVAALAIAGLHPNPAVDRLVVSFRLPNNSPARLELFDITGRMLASRDVENAGTGLREMDISQGLHLAAGVYSIRLRQGGQAAVARAVVMR